MTKLFGFSLEDNEPLSPGAVSPIPPNNEDGVDHYMSCLLYTSPSPRDYAASRMPSSA